MHQLRRAHIEIRRPSLAGLIKMFAGHARREISFDAREATVSSVRQALHSGSASCRDIVQAFLARIELHNPVINAIITLNPNALKDADELDRQIAANQATGVLLGVPILLKDNFDAVGMPTTGGSLALRDFYPQKDATTVTALRRAGAIILGKANLHEFALEGLTVSSLGGQTLNPYDLTRTPGGSSGGSGAAVAASFAVMATGTDTVNSLRSPASANGLYSFRPTPGLISRAGIIPVSSTQDTAGMIGRSLLDIATALTVMSSPGPDSADPATVAVPDDCSKTDYTQNLITPSPKSLSSHRIGILREAFEMTSSSESDPVNRTMHQVRSLLQNEGATLTDITDDDTFNITRILSTTDVQMYEIRNLMNSYLSSLGLTGKHPVSFSDIFSRHSDFLVIPVQYPYIHTALTSSNLSPEYAIRKSKIDALIQALRRTFQTHNLDAIIYPQQRNLVVPAGSPSQHGRNGILAATTGSPSICMPVGFSPPSTTAPIGLPIGMEILGMPWTETKLFEIARGIDEKLKARRSPITMGLNEDVDLTSTRYECMPQVVPGGLASVDLNAYPPGRVQSS